MREPKPLTLECDPKSIPLQWIPPIRPQLPPIVRWYQIDNFIEVQQTIPPAREFLKTESGRFLKGLLLMELFVVSFENNDGSPRPKVGKEDSTRLLFREAGQPGEYRPLVDLHQRESCE